MISELSKTKNNTSIAEVAGVTFSDYESPPAPKFFNPGPAPKFRIQLLFRLQQGSHKCNSKNP